MDLKTSFKVFVFTFVDTENKTQISSIFTHRTPVRLI